MKLRLLLLLSVILFLSACRQDGPCLPTPCPKQDLNLSLAIELYFCNADQGDECFSDEDLSQIALVSKYHDDNHVISVDSFFNLANFNNTINFGEEGLPLTASDELSSSLDLHFEAVVLNTGHHFIISDIEIANVPSSVPCDCPRYEIVQLKLNDEIIAINAPLARLVLNK